MCCRTLFRKYFYSGFPCFRQVLKYHQDVGNCTKYLDKFTYINSNVYRQILNLLVKYECIIKNIYLLKLVRLHLYNLSQIIFYVTLYIAKSEGKQSQMMAKTEEYFEQVEGLVCDNFVSAFRVFKMFTFYEVGLFEFVRFYNK